MRVVSEPKCIVGYMYIAVRAVHIDYNIMLFLQISQDSELMLIINSTATSFTLKLELNV